MDRSAIPLRADKSTFYDLFHFRQSPTQSGLLEQIPFCEVDATRGAIAGTYWDGASSVTEVSTSKIRLCTVDTVITDYVVRGPANTQMQVFYQTIVPSGTTVYTGCRLVINSIAGLAITLGSTLDVEMTGVATFRWRKNSGAWTAGLVPSTAGVSIDGGNATLYFLASTGFAGTETWSWQRTDQASYTGTASITPLKYSYYKQELFFLTPEQRLMHVVNFTSARYAITAGYRPIYGTSFCFYFSFLVVGGYADNTSVSVYSRGRTVGWSDVNDVHNLIATDLNEADQYVLPASNQTSSYVDGVNLPMIVGLSVIKQQLFVYTTQEIFTTTYLGLPTVFSFVKCNDVQLSRLIFNIRNLIVTPIGTFLFGVSDLWLFDGTQLISYGRPLNSITGFRNATYGEYYSFREEVVIVNPAVAYILQLKTNTWYSRAVSFSASGATCVGVHDSSSLYFGTESLKLVKESAAWIIAPVYDTANGTSYAVPKVTTQLIGEELSTVKESLGVLLGWYITTVTANFYATNTNVLLQVSWYNSDNGTMSGSVSTDSDAIRNATSTDFFIGYPRTAFRSLALEISISPTSGTKPPGRVYLTAIEPLLYLGGADR